MASATKEYAGNGWVDAVGIVLDLVLGISVAGGLPRITPEARNSVAQELPWSKDMTAPPQVIYDQEMTFLRNVKKYERLLISVSVDLGVKLQNHRPAEIAARFWIARILRLIRTARHT